MPARPQGRRTARARSTVRFAQRQRIKQWQAKARAVEIARQKRIAAKRVVEKARSKSAKSLVKPPQVSKIYKLKKLNRPKLGFNFLGDSSKTNPILKKYPPFNVLEKIQPARRPINYPIRSTPGIAVSGLTVVAPVESKPVSPTRLLERMRRRLRPKK